MKPSHTHHNRRSKMRKTGEPAFTIDNLEPRLHLASQAYNWQNAPLGGGGFVTGIVFSPTVPNLIYARTDVGGAYRWDQGVGRWTPLTDWITYNDPASTGVEGLAIDPNDFNRVYATIGTYTPSWAGNAAVLRSTDRGQTWQRTNVPFKMGGNENGRSNGERLMVDPNSDHILFLATPDNGLWKSSDFGATWNQVSSFPITATANGVGLNFVQFVKSSGAAGSATPTIYVGVSQTVNNLYRSIDGGTTWQNVSNPSLNATQMPARAVQDSSGNMYVTYGIGPGPNGVDNPSGTLAGSVWKLQLSTGTWTNITPNTNGQGGFSGVSVDPQHPGTLVVTTMDRWWPADDVYRSTNSGATWTSLRNTDITPWAWTDKIQWDLSLEPYITSGGFGWPGDIEIDPFNANHVMVSYGGGIASSFDLTSADSGAATHWSYFDNGLEETVQIALVSPPSGAPVLTAAGDVGGERFADLTTPPVSYNIMTGTNRDIDFAESNSNLLVRSADASPNIAYSRNNGVTWTAFPSLPANTGTGTGSMDNAGLLAMSADGNTVVWDPGDDTSNNLKFPLSYSTWNGSAWSSWSTSNWTGSADVNPVADRLTAGDFYILDGAHLYLSTNGGVSWTLKSSSAPSGTLEASFAAAGDLWISANGNGLWHSTNFGATWTHVASAAITNSSSVGFGKAAAGQTYPAIYVTGSGNGTTGMFRSDDGGTTWLTISDSQHQFSGAIVGDRNIYGRVYIGAGARGVIYGDIQSTAPSAATAAAASPVVGNTSNLSVLGSDDGGESNLTYTWRVTNKPPGSTLPTFSTNGTNAAKNTVATFAQPGFYSFQVALTDAQGHVMISSVGLTVFVSIGAFNSDLDIGSPSPTGSSSYNAGTGTYTVAGGGSDIWNTSDQFHFLSKSFTGDGVMIARVTSVQNTNTWAKAGVMFRDSTAANSMFADVLVSYSSGVTFQWRNSTGGTADYALISGIAAPAWVKLVRGGNSFTAFYATTAGTPAAGNWIQIGTPQAIAMGSGIQAGLAVTSHANGTLCTSTFTGVLVNQNPTVATAASATPNPANSTTSALSALGADDGGEANLAYTWSTTGAPPAAVSFSANGTNAAKNTTATFTKAGTYSFLVTVTDALGLATTSAVSVVVNQSPTLVTVAPNPVTVAGGATKQFSATVTDQFGQPIVSPSVTWSTSGGGSTDTSGLFTASQTGGAFNVTAKSGSASGSAAVNVVPSIYTGTASADNYYVRLSADGVTEQLWVGSTTGAGVPTYTIAQSQLTSLAFNGMGGADSLTVDFTNGNPVPSSGVSFDGGSGSTGNLLVVDGSGSADTATLSASSVVFNSVAPIAYANTQSLTLATAGGNDVVTQAAQPAVPNVVFNGGSGSDTLNVNAGAFSFNTDAGAGTSSLTVNVAGNGSSASFSGDQHLAGLTLTSSAVVVVTAAASDLSPAIVNVTALGFDASAGAKLDLVNNELITGDSLSLVRSLIVQGHLWTSIAGRAVGSSDMGGGQVEARPTLQGDANLDGSVNVGDLGSLATHYGTSSGAVWTDGDFDYNGAVDVADLGYLASGFAASLGGAAVPAAMAASISATDAPATSIPTQKSDAAKPTRSTSFTFATGSSLGDLTTPRESIADLTDHHHGRHLYDSFWRSESEPLDPA